MPTVLEEHFGYLSDAARMEAFEKAIRQLVRPGDVVVDLGSGTGILGLFACRAGARRVYSIESTGLVGVAREIALANGFSDRITFINEHSRRAELPERADVVVADQLVGFGFEAGLFESFADGRDRFLKPGGIAIPGTVEFMASPVEAAELRSLVDFWDERPFSFDVSALSSAARNGEHFSTFSESNLLGAPAVVASVDPSTPTRGAIRCAATFQIFRSGTLHGVGGWFSANLAPGVVLTSSPISPARIRRSHAFLPLEHPVSVVAGDCVDFEMRVLPSEALVQHATTVTDAEGRVKAQSRGSNLEAMILSQDDLRRMRPDAAPRRSPRGEARRAVLEFCDGTRALSEIEAEIYARYQTLFRGPEDAAQFVASVVARDTL